jgi:5-methylcytosine-specific restriction protein A
MSLHLNRDWLYQKYIVEQLSTYDIGKIVSRDPKRVYEKLRDFEIPTRPRGLNLKGDDCYGKRIASGEVPNSFQGKNHTKETRQRLSEKASVPKPYLRGKGNGMYHRRGPQNPNWKGGGTPERQRIYASTEWRETVRSVYARDNYLCQRCGDGHTSKNKLHAHHIFGWTEFPELRLSLSNLVTLCDGCHCWVHSKKNKLHQYLGLTQTRSSSRKTSSRSESDSSLFS